MADKVSDPLIEVLAIKLYEHDHDGKWPIPPGRTTVSWMALDPEDREIFRRMARGEEPLGGDDYEDDNKDADHERA